MSAGMLGLAALGAGVLTTVINMADRTRLEDDNTILLDIPWKADSADQLDVTINRFSRLEYRMRIIDNGEFTKSGFDSVNIDGTKHYKVFVTNPLHDAAGSLNSTSTYYLNTKTGDLFSEGKRVRAYHKIGLDVIAGWKEYLKPATPRLAKQ